MLPGLWLWYGPTDQMENSGTKCTKGEYVGRRICALLPSLLCTDPGEQAAVWATRFTCWGKDTN